VAPFKTPALAGFDESKASGRVVLLNSTREAQRFNEVIPEAHIGQPWIAQVDEQGQVVKFRAQNFLLVRDAGGERRHADAQTFKQRGKGAVELVAEAATTLADDLPDETLRVEKDLAAPADIEILKRHAQHVPAMDLAQRVDAKRKGTFIADSVVIGAGIHQRTSRFPGVLQSVSSAPNRPAYTAVPRIESWGDQGGRGT